MHGIAYICMMHIILQHVFAWFKLVPMEFWVHAHHHGSGLYSIVLWLSQRSKALVILIQRSDHSPWYMAVIRYMV